VGGRLPAHRGRPLIAPPDLSGQVALVTGGAGGLGEAICRALSGAGASVWVCDVRADAAVALAAGLSQGGATCHAASFDVADADQVAATVARVLETSGRIDVLVNNAATDVSQPLEKMAPADARRVVSTNLLGPFYLILQVYPHLLERNSGHIINILSTAGRRVWTEVSAYAASKAGLGALTDALFKEVQRDCLQRHGSVGIGVTGVLPGGMNTRFITDRFPDTPRELLQDPANVADAVLFALGAGPGSVVPLVSMLPATESSW
jgi:NAD(P)-dependent dehydrogenase (short-subunit alcohol dehydrogenase family)